MSKYMVEAEVTISTTVEPQGYISDNGIDGVENFDTESFSGYGNDIDDTCRITFEYVTEADDEDVEDEVQQQLMSNLTYDGDELEWEIQDVNILTCEKQEMSLEEAKTVLRDFVSQYGNEADDANKELCSAITVVLEQL